MRSRGVPLPHRKRDKVTARHSAAVNNPQLHADRFQMIMSERGYAPGQKTPSGEIYTQTGKKKEFFSEEKSNTTVKKKYCVKDVRFKQRYVCVKLIRCAPIAAVAIVPGSYVNCWAAISSQSEAGNFSQLWYFSHGDSWSGVVLNTYTVKPPRIWELSSESYWVCISLSHWLSGCSRPLL